MRRHYWMHLDKVMCTLLLGDYFVYLQPVDEPRGHVFV